MEILAIDDERIALEGLVRAIREAEPMAEVHGFRKAAEALEFYKTVACEVIFMDIQMRNENGVELAQQMKLINPGVNIIFATGYGDYREEAFDMHASGYVMKPITSEKVRKELDNLRHPVFIQKSKKIYLHTFGNFEVYVEGIPVKFKYDRTKELLAYLVNRKGTYCTNAEIMAALWEDKKHASYLGNLKKDLFDTLDEKGCRDIIEAGRGKMRIATERVECDYYDWCDGRPEAINKYRGEYMAQYSWAEFVNAEIYRNRTL